MSEFGRMLDEAQERIQALEQQNAELKRQIRQIDDALVVRWITVKDGDYRKAINDLISWEIQVHDDPSVSTRAKDVQKLVDAARHINAVKPRFDQHSSECQELMADHGEDCSCHFAALTEALKPFEQEPVPQEGKG